MTVLAVQLITPSACEDPMLPAPKTVAELDALISCPPSAVIESVRRQPGRFAVLGAGGKMGFHITLMLQKALEQAGRPDRVIAVSRFGESSRRRPFEDAGLEVISADLAEPEQVAALPDAENVISLAAIKFGTSGRPDLLQRINIETSRLVTDRYRDSRISMLSTGCVYPFVTPASGGCTEDSPATAPGEYAQSRLAQEQIFAEASASNGTPVALVRLNYSIDLRYGVLLDIARKVWQRQPLDVTMGYANVIWQGDAVAHIIRSLEVAATPAVPLNITGPEILSIRELAQTFGKRFGISPEITGTESDTAWLNNAARSHQLFGTPQVSLNQMVEWVASWVECNGETYNKPTHFESRGDGY
ncbi:MAG: NAD(P)-dependent oxidoreductase [Planctomycetaceae bacterium]|nr:NAD(P)-dependent oxidoreductase [Planctomycetaceae bacterium]